MQLIGTLAFLVVVSFASSAAAYRTASDLPDFPNDALVRWLVMPTVVVEPGGPANLSTNEIADAVTSALATWNAPTCSALSLTDDGASAAAGQIVVTWVHDWTERGLRSSLPGTTDIHYVDRGAGWSIDAANILLNVESQTWTTTGEARALDLQAVLTHELGHALGLLHVCELRGEDDAPVCGTSVEHEDAAMFPLYSGLAQRTLGQDDVEGLCSLYEAWAPCASNDLDACDGPEILEPSLLSSMGDPCADDTECSSSRCSVEGYCTTDCGSGGSCPLGYRCGSIVAATARECLPQGVVFGEACDTAQQCVSSFCALTHGAEHGACTRACDPTTKPCPAGYTCRDAGGQFVCIEAHERSASCSAHAAVPSTQPWAICLILGFIARRFTSKRRNVR